MNQVSTPVLRRPAARRSISPAAPRSPTPVRTAATPQAGAHVTLHGVVKRFGARTVLRALSLDVRPGSFVSIVGLSGGGKSTLLCLLAGLDLSDAGHITHDDTTLNGLAPRTTMMFQDARLLPWQSVISNVGIARRGDWQRDAMAALDAVGLADRANDWPAVLSGGQRQRVALARALVGHPRLLLLDEPLGALDALTRGDMQRLIERLWQAQGFTAILVTHDVSEAVALSDRVLVLKNGGIALDQPVALPRPRQRAVAAVAGLEATILDQLLTRQDAT